MRRDQSESLAQSTDLLQKREFEIDRKIPELEPLIRKGCSIGSKDNFLRPFDEIRMVFMKGVLLPRSAFRFEVG